MSVPSDKNVSCKTFEKLSKYKDLEIEIGKMWHLTARTISVVIGALGLVKKGTKEFPYKMPGNPSLQEIQKIVLSGTAQSSEEPYQYNFQFHSSEVTGNNPMFDLITCISKERTIIIVIIKYFQKYCLRKGRDFFLQKPSAEAKIYFKKESRKK